MHRTLFLLGCLAIPTVAIAGPCTFQTSGDPRNGLTFKAQTQVAGLSIGSALGQLQQVAQERGYQLGNELLQPTSGQLTFLQTSNQPPLVLVAHAEGGGRVSLTLTLARGQKVEPAAVEKELCLLLGSLKPGPEGEAIAAAARAKSGLGKVLSVEATALSKSLEKEIKKAMAPANRDMVLRLLAGKEKEASPREVEELFAPIRAKYVGQTYRIEGRVWTTSGVGLSSMPTSREALVNPRMEVIFDVRAKKGLLGVREDSTQQDLHFQIVCHLAKDQYPFFSTLAPGDAVTLTGIVSEIFPGRVDSPGRVDLREARRSD